MCKFSLVANCPHSGGGELCGGCQEQNLQGLGLCRYLALGISGKTFWCNYLFCAQNLKALSCVCGIFDELLCVKLDEGMSN